MAKWTKTMAVAVLASALVLALRLGPAPKPFVEPQEESGTGADPLEPEPYESSKGGSPEVRLPEPADSPKEEPLPSALPGQLVEEIWEKHRPRFEDLHAVHSARLDILVERVLRDYEKYKEKKAKLLSLAPRYYKLGLDLEKQADASFETALADLESDLVSNGLPTDLALKVKKEYEDMKDSRRREMLAAAAKALGS